MHSQVLAKVSLPFEGASPEHVYTGYQEKIALIYDGHLYNPKTRELSFLEPRTG
jgi:hypothetical protein